MVKFLFGSNIDTWPKKARAHKIIAARNFCKNNPKWKEYWSRIND